MQTVLALLLLPWLLNAIEWQTAKPGSPCNVSVTVTHTAAEIQWMHSLPEDGGLATHYVVKWQVKNSQEVHWHPDYVGLGSERIVLADLYAGSEYGVRVAAVNPQGHAWSGAATFRLLSTIQCEANMKAHWIEGGLIDQAEANHLCGPYADWRAVDPEARDGACSAGFTSYTLAGVAAGVTASIILIAALRLHAKHSLSELVPTDGEGPDATEEKCDEHGNGVRLSRVMERVFAAEVLDASTDDRNVRDDHAVDNCDDQSADRAAPRNTCHL